MKGDPETHPAAPPGAGGSAAPQLAVVLVSPKTAGNVGAAARAMLNMGASDLRLVAPRTDHLAGDALAMAVHAGDVLRSARLYPTLRQALADRDLSIGTTARHRSDLPDPQHPARLRPLVRAAHAPALIFGPEESGLSNEDLQRCQAAVKIPTASYASLNLAQAVLLVTYEFLQGGEGEREGAVDPPDAAPLPRGHRAASSAEMEGLYDHLRDTMLLTGYSDAVRAPHTLRLWRAWIDRARPSTAETRLLRGLLRQTRWKIEEAWRGSERRQRGAAGTPAPAPTPPEE